MSRRKLAAAITVVLSALMMPSIQAQDQGSGPYAAGPMMMPAQLPDRPRSNGMPQPVSYHRAEGVGPTGPGPTPIDANLGLGVGPVTGPVQQEGYVRLGAPMYPCPRPNIPIWAGSTVITNQALAPHEMLYPHTYRAMYPPYYHRVKGHWLLTPLGVRSHEKWELQGTMVQVKYRSSYPGIFSGANWHPPATSYSGGAWR
jgi:hypothetical protein